MNKHRVLLVDMNLLFFRNYTVITEINDQGIEIGGYSGTITMLLSIVGRLDPDFVICAWDGKNGSSKRRKMYGNYKEGRKVPNKIGDKKTLLDMSDEERKASITWQMNKVFNTLQFLPFLQIELDNCEGDDIISYVCTEQFAREKDVEIIIVSNDKDFLQLVKKNVHVYRRTSTTINGVKHGEDTIYDQQMVKEKYNGLSRGSYLTMRMFEGDNSDNIRGINGVAEKTFVKHLGSLAEIDNLDPRDVIDFLKGKAEQFSNPQYLKEHKEDEHLKIIVNKVATHKEKDTDLSGFDVLTRNYNIMQLQHCILSLDNKYLMDEKISNYDPILDLLNFYATLKRDGVSVVMSGDAHSILPQLVRRTTEFLNAKYLKKEEE